MAIKSRSAVKADNIIRYTRQPGDPLAEWITPAKHRDLGTDLSDSSENILEGARPASGGALVFDWAKGYVHGTLAEPVTGNISFVTTGALKGARVVVVHQDTVKPSLPESVVKYSGSDTFDVFYTVGIPNILVFTVLNEDPANFAVSLQVDRDFNKNFQLYSSAGSFVGYSRGIQDGLSSVSFVANGERTAIPYATQQHNFITGNTEFDFSALDLGDLTNSVNRLNVVDCAGGPVVITMGSSDPFPGFFYLHIINVSETNYCRIILADGVSFNANQLPRETVGSLPGIGNSYIDVTTERFYRPTADGSGKWLFLLGFGSSEGSGGTIVQSRFTEQNLTYADPVVWDYALGSRAYLTLTGTAVLEDITNMQVGDVAQLRVVVGADNAELKLLIGYNTARPVGQLFPDNATAGDVFMISIIKTTGDVDFEITIVQLDVLPANVGPTANPVTATGTPQVGATTVFGYAYNDADGDAQDTTAGGSTFSLRYYADATAAAADTNGTAGTQIVGGAVASLWPYSYTWLIGDLGRVTRMWVYPRASVGTLEGTPAGSAVQAAVAAAAPDAPVISLVADTGGVSQASSPSPFTSTEAITVNTTGSNRRLVFAVVGERSNEEGVISSATFNGVALTPIEFGVRSGGTQEYVALFELLDANIPASGTYNLVINWTKTPLRYATKVLLLTGANQLATASLVRQQDAYISAETALNFTPFTIPGPGLLLTVACQTFWFNAPIVAANGQATLLSHNIPVSGSESKALVFTKYVNTGSVASNFTKAAGSVNGIAIQVYFPAA